ncbi:MAG: hypothetical protein M1828_004121 [Chrysothrix sp. TS-e1954]|nr:MAG: hypothetical protein M1828_004121 [Chrysothrix sp. TS-e1954]
MPTRTTPLAAIQRLEREITKRKQQLSYQRDELKQSNKDARYDDDLMSPGMTPLMLAEELSCLEWEWHCAQTHFQNMARQVRPTYYAVLAPDVEHTVVQKLLQEYGNKYYLGSSENVSPQLKLYDDKYGGTHLCINFNAESQWAADELKGRSGVRAIVKGYDELVKTKAAQITRPSKTPGVVCLFTLPYEPYHESGEKAM